jgi:plasmid stabilization system protein ParE
MPQLDTKPNRRTRQYLLAVRDAVNRLQVMPSAYPIVEAELRRCLVKRFPYGVLYQNTPHEHVIVAVMHLRRDPDYWKSRIP